MVGVGLQLRKAAVDLGVEVERGKARKVVTAAEVLPVNEGHVRGESPDLEVDHVIDPGRTRRRKEIGIVAETGKRRRNIKKRIENETAKRRRKTKSKGIMMKRKKSCTRRKRRPMIIGKVAVMKMMTMMMMTMIKVGEVVRSRYLLV